MAKSIDKPKCTKRIGTSKSEDAAHGRTSVKCRPRKAIIQQLGLPESKFVNLLVSSVNVGFLRSRSGVTEEMLECRSVDICCIQETRFRGNPIRMISGKAGEYKLFRIGNEEDLRQEYKFSWPRVGWIKLLIQAG